MAAASSDEANLQSRINKATNPLNKETDWDNINGFCDHLQNEPEGPQLATRLLAHKIQSPQEWEAMQALTVLETCMKNCGRRFHIEVGKFRFLNELIKVVSPKYLGSRAPEPVKRKVLEMMYSWTMKLPDETKIADAYHMLKKQGIVKQDPVLPDDKPLPPPPPRSTSAIFEDEEKSKTLSRLLNSSHPDDLRAANKLIKEMVQEDQKRVEKVSKRVNAIQEVNESVRLLSQLLEGYSKESCSHSNQELIKDLYQRCEKMRPTLFRLASDTEDSDEALADILQANDSLTLAINKYRQLVKGEDVTKDGLAMPSQIADSSSSSTLVDLTGLNVSADFAPSSLESVGLQDLTQNLGMNLMDDELMSLGLNAGENCDAHNRFQSSESTSTPGSTSPAVLLPAVVPAAHAGVPAVVPAAHAGVPAVVPAAHPGVPAVPKAMEELDLLGKTLMQHSLPPESQQVKWDKIQPHSKVPLRDLQTKSSSNPAALAATTNTTTSSSSFFSSSCAPGEQHDVVLHSSVTVSQKNSSPAIDSYDNSISLADVNVPLESIKPTCYQ
ncbi:ADP-ribosylation factor-binding protein GGA1-like isoform X2 [Gouania willdenowi]|uniref:ADP-ribosylation factor-binding protein GGA1-like isoform X2 n=1 Tax=Gouania willdenowi TaxID=441366 RepID=UPI00105579EB|nr:ADP-ribosylation factor-binding protein GGA1-like isoform X2 [Gouania willdenowi]